MKTIAIRLSVSAILVLGGASAASAQGESAAEFTDVGCVFNLALIDGVPEPFANLAPATVEGNTVFCPGSVGNEAVILECVADFNTIAAEPWPGVEISTNNFPCFVNASQCGNSVTRLATSQRFTVDEFGNAALRCSVARTQ